MQKVRKDALEDYTRSLRVSYLIDMLNYTWFYSVCYERLFRKKKNVEIELSSGEEDDVLDIKPKLEEIEPCTSSSLRH
jgi:hypothetical protein